MTKLTDNVIYVVGLIIISILVLLFINTNIWAGGVTDDNNGNAGYIFISTGQNNGKDSVGHWTDINTIPELKGEKGDAGAQGLQGIQGIKGDTGVQGIQGLQGLNGDKGEQGIQGIKGDTGEQGIKGDNGTDGINGTNGINGEQGLQGIQGEKGNQGDVGVKGDIGDKGDKGDIGLQGLRGQDVDPTIVNNLQNNIDNESKERISNNNSLNNRINDMSNRVDNIDNRVKKLERTQYCLETDIRILDTKRLTISPYFRENFTRAKVDEVGVRVTIKLGSSYEEREIAKTNKRLDNLESYLGTPEVKEAIEQVKMKKINVQTDGKSFWIEKKF